MAKEQITKFNQKNYYNEKILPKINELKLLCNDEKLPFFIAIPVNSTEKSREYSRRAIEMVLTYMEGYIANTQRWMSPSVVWDSIQVFMHGCDFGIAIYTGDSISFENASDDKSLQVGYMLGLQKEICFLKHQELNKAPSDLAEMIYVEFTPDNLREVLFRWLTRRQIID